MSAAPVRMHAEELEIGAQQVRALLREQFPQWAELPLQRTASAGTDNAIFRLGDAMAIRLPRIYWAAQQPELEFHLLPWLAPQLSLPTAMPIALGAPSRGYPHAWLVYQWLEGVDAFVQPPEDPRQTASDLARYIAALRAVDFAAAPQEARPFLTPNASLRALDERVQVALREVATLTDANLARQAWERALAAPEWHGAPRFTHGDLHAPNLLVRAQRIAAVIDFGSSGLGDPAREFIAAWTTFDAASRAVFRSELAARGLIDDAMWARARGYALSKALFALPYYQQSNPTLIAIAEHTLAQIYAEVGSGQ